MGEDEEPDDDREFAAWMRAAILGDSFPVSVGKVLTPWHRCAHNLYMNTDTITAELTGVTSATGECDHCGRELGRVYEVRYSTGESVSLGRRCATKATGYTFSALERELRQRTRLAEVARRLAVIDTERPDLATITAEPACYIRQDCAVQDAWWGGRGYTYDATWQGYADRMIG